MALYVEKLFDVLCPYEIGLVQQPRLRRSQPYQDLPHQFHQVALQSDIRLRRSLICIDLFSTGKRAVQDVDNDSVDVKFSIPFVNPKFPDSLEESILGNLEGLQACIPTLLDAKITRCLRSLTASDHSEQPAEWPRSERRRDTSASPHCVCYYKSANQDLELVYYTAQCHR